MTILINIIGCILSAIVGAICLELFWYERRRRKNRREEILIRNAPFSCPRCPAEFKELPAKCNWCGYEFGTPGTIRKDNPPSGGEKEK